MKWLWFKERDVAQAAIDFIAERGPFPFLSGNGNKKGKTMYWSSPTKRNDGKWGFLAASENLKKNIPLSFWNNFSIIFPHEIEDYKREDFINPIAIRRKNKIE